MTEKSISINQLEAQIDTLAIAFRALFDTLPVSQAAQLRSNVATRLEQALKRDEPIKETNPYVLEARAFASTLLQDGPEQPLFGEQPPHTSGQQPR